MNAQSTDCPSSETPMEEHRSITIQSENLFNAGKKLHEPLPDASNHIRLLRFEQSPNTDSEDIRLSMSTWCISTAPPYKAMSYMWGQPDDTAYITVNERSVLVRRNCQYVLWQARLHYPNDFIWIDSISINQDDLHEKSVQVAMMFNVYSAASMVLACIGCHDEDSKTLFEEITTRMAEHEVIGLTSWYQFMLADRPYFWRLWIVQELYAAKHNLEILCGPDKLPWASIAWLSGQSATDLAQHNGLWLNPTEWGTKACYSATAWKLKDVFKDFRDADCFDPRDRLFGLLALIKWPAGVDPIAPDYTKTTFDLALQLARFLEDDSLDDMLRAFKISYNTPDMMALVSTRKRPSSGLTTPACGSKIYNTSRNICSYGGGFTIIGRLESYHVPGYLTCSLLEYLMIDARELKDILASMPDVDKSQQPLLYKKYRLGLVCANAEAGDFIVAICGQRRHFLGHTAGVRGYLVLRHNHGTHYDLIGQGLVPIPAGFTAIINYSPYDEADQRYAKLEVSFTAEDKIVLVGQDLKDRGSEVYRKREIYDMEACFRRLLTCPAADPQCAVKITWQGSAKDMRENHPDWYEEFDKQRRRYPRGR